MEGKICQQRVCVWEAWGQERAGCICLRRKWHEQDGGWYGCGGVRFKCNGKVLEQFEQTNEVSQEDPKFSLSCSTDLLQ